jgi:hypothetical protein|tara:strand:- start:328 stop:435 length:108 start_codon:yes stop_codon:yes gene_type:complete
VNILFSAVSRIFGFVAQAGACASAGKGTDKAWPLV